MLDVLVATVDKNRRPGGLEHIGQSYRLLVDDRKGWAESSNYLLDQAAEAGHDALFLDDDVTLTPATLALLPRYYDRASVFGFTLLTPSQGDWHIASAGMRSTPSGTLVPAKDTRDVLEPAYVAHVTTSAIYLKAEVLRAGIRFPIWPGMHYEDVAFTFDCWLHGFKVAYIPGLAEHPLTHKWAGATKSGIEGFDQQRTVNLGALQGWMHERGVLEALASGRIPTERVSIGD